MVYLLLLSTLAFSAPGSVETKEELSLRLLGKRPSASASPESGTDAPEAMAAAVAAPVAPAKVSLPTLALPTQVPSEAKAEAAAIISGSTAEVENVAGLPEVATPKALVEQASSNELANERLRQQELVWKGDESKALLTPPDTSEEGAEYGLSNMMPWWLPALFFGGLGLFALSRRPGGLGQLAGGAAPAPMRVLSRTALGQNSGLALVELDTGDGETRRVLVGFGGGAPNLVTDLTGNRQAPVATTPTLRVVPSPKEVSRPEPEQFDLGDFEPRVSSRVSSPLPLPREKEPKPVIRAARPEAETSSSRRSVLSARSATLRPPTFSKEESSGFAAAFEQEMTTPVQRRSADEARALVDEVLAEREPSANREQRRSRPWAGTRFEGTA